MSANLDRAARAVKNIDDPWVRDVLIDVLAWAQGEAARTREAEREATPPSDPAPVVGDEPGVGAVVRPRLLDPGVHEPCEDDGVTYCGYAGDGGISRGCGRLWPCPDRSTTEAPAAPAPGEDAVEALVTILRDPKDPHHGDLAPDPARPDAVQVPQVVAWRYDSVLHGSVVITQEKQQRCPVSMDETPLVTEPDAVAYAEALAGQRVRQERAAVVAWLRDGFVPVSDVFGWSSVALDAADAIERGDHLDPS